MVSPGRVGTVVTGEADGAPEVGLFGATVCKLGVIVGEELGVGVSVLGVALEGEAVLGEKKVIGLVGPAVGVAVGIVVGVDEVRLGVEVGVRLGVGVKVGVRLGVEVEGLPVGVRLGVKVGVRLGVLVLGAVKCV